MYFMELRPAGCRVGSHRAAVARNPVITCSLVVPPLTLAPRLPRSPRPAGPNDPRGEITLQPITLRRELRGWKEPAARSDRGLGRGGPCLPPPGSALDLRPSAAYILAPAFRIDSVILSTRTIHSRLLHRSLCGGGGASHRTRQWYNCTEVN